jgi:hypothetical protein
MEPLNQLPDAFLDMTEPLDKIYQEKLRPLMESPFLSNTFHWVVALEEKELLYKTNIKKVLGYETEEFTFAKSFEVVYASYKHFIFEYGKVAYDLLMDKRYEMQRSMTHVCLQYPMKHQNGRFLLVQMDCCIVQMDIHGKPRALYHRFEVLGLYKLTPVLIRPYVYFRAPNALFWTDAMRKGEAELALRAKQNLLNALGFTLIEQVILKNSLDNTSLKIAENRDRSINTIKSQKKKILQKARKALSPHFQNVRDVVEYLYQIALI